MSNIRVGVGKKGVVLALVIGVLLLGGGGGYLLWRVNQEDTVAPTDSDASEECDDCGWSCTTCQAGYQLVPISADRNKCCKIDGGVGSCSAAAGNIDGCNYRLNKESCYQYECGRYFFYNVDSCASRVCHEYTLTYTAGAGGSIRGTAIQRFIFYSMNGSEVEAVPNSGYKFVRWSDGKFATAKRRDTDVRSNITANAVFEALQIETVTLTYTAGAGGTITGTTPQTINKGASGTVVTATPNTGYRFVKWSDNKTTAARTDTNVQASATYTATFEVLAADKVTLTYVAGTGGTITGTATQTIDKGASGTAVTATPNTGYAFEKWSDGKTTAARTDTNVQASATYTATFISTSPTTPVNCTGFTLSCGTNNTININWNLVTGAVKYIARINKAPKSDWLNEAGGDVWISLGADVNSYVIENAQSGIVYGVNVLAYDGPDGQTDFHPSCNMTGLGQVWDPPMYLEISCQGTTPVVDPGNGTVPDTGIFDNSKHTMIFGFVVLVIGLAWTWISTLPQKAFFAISSTSSKLKEENEKKRVERRRNRLERRLK